MSRKHLLAAVFATAGGFGLQSARALPIFRVDMNSDNLPEQNNPNYGYSETEAGLGTPASPAFEPWFINGGVEPDPNDEFGPPLFDPRANTFVYSGYTLNPNPPVVSKARITLTAGSAAEKIDAMRRFGLVPGEGSGALANYYFNDLYRDHVQVTHDDTSVYSTLTTRIENNPDDTTGPLLAPNTAYNVTFFVYDKFFDPGGNNSDDPVQGNTTFHFTDLTEDGLGMHSDSHIFNRLGVKNGGGANDFGSSPPTPLDNYTWSTTLTLFTDANGQLEVRQVVPDAIAGGIIRGTAAQGGNRQISPLLNGLEIDNAVNSASSGAWSNPATWADGIVPSNSTALKSQAANFFNNAGGTVSLTGQTGIAYLNFAGSGAYTIAGNGNTLVLQSNKGPNASVSIAARSGSHTIDAAVRVDNRLFATINGGATVSITGPITFGSNLYGSQVTDSLGNQQPTMLFKGGNGTLVVGAAPFDQVTISAGTLRTTAGVSQAKNIVFGLNNGAPTARLDLTGGIWAVDYAADSSIPSRLIDMITVGRADNAYTGNGITSSLAAADARYAVAYADAAALGAAVVTGTSVPVTATTFLFRVTLRGDSDLDGLVDFNDLLTLAQNYQAGAGKTWLTGDNNYDGLVNFDDLLALAQNYNSSMSAVESAGLSEAFLADWALAQSLVPEPATLGALAMGALLIRRRR